MPFSYQIGAFKNPVFLEISMKKQYPRYEANDMQRIEETMSRVDIKILNDFCEHCRATASEEKVKKIRRIFIQLYDVTEKDLNKQNIESITSFLAVLNNSDRSIPTKNEMKSYLKKFLKWYFKDLQLIEDLSPVLKRENFEVNTKRINEGNLITEQEIERMLRFAQNFMEKAFIFLAFESGARPQEIVTLRWKDIKFNEGFADISFYSGKTKQSRVFPVRKARQFLWEWKQNYTYDSLILAIFKIAIVSNIKSMKINKVKILRYPITQKV